MSSIRRRLVLSLALVTGLVWLGGVGWIGLHIRAELDRMLDARLGEVGRMVRSMTQAGDIDPLTLAQAAHFATRHEEGGQRRPYISCQIWDAQGRLVGRSDGAPREPLAATGLGFTDTMVGDERWRVFAVADEARGLRFLIGDSLEARDALTRQIVLALLLPAALLLPLLAGLIWWAVSLGLRPLGRAAEALRARAPGDLAPLPGASLPAEVRPMFEALDGLLEKLSLARAQEQTFTAFAAHELRTPVAGLKLQAQVALAAPDPATREAALARIIQAADRMAAMITQLLELARIEGERRPMDVPVAAEGLVREMAGRIDPSPVSLQVTAAVQAMALRINPEMLGMALRNLLENAFRHSPPGAAVTCDAELRGAEVAIMIADRGPGIPSEEMEHVRKRFFRGRHRGVQGAGLGLAIAEAAMRQLGGRLALRNREEGGLVAELLLPAESLGGAVPQGARAG